MGEILFLNYWCTHGILGWQIEIYAFADSILACSEALSFLNLSA